jgi:hypothetical protein
LPALHYLTTTNMEDRVLLRALAELTVEHDAISQQNLANRIIDALAKAMR